MGLGDIANYLVPKSPRGRHFLQRVQVLGVLEIKEWITTYHIKNLSFNH